MGRSTTKTGASRLLVLEQVHKECPHLATLETKGAYLPFDIPMTRRISCSAVFVFLMELPLASLHSWLFIYVIWSCLWSVRGKLTNVNKSKHVLLNTTRTNEYKQVIDHILFDRISTCNATSTFVHVLVRGGAICNDSLCLGVKCGHPLKAAVHVQQKKHREIFPVKYEFFWRPETPSWRGQQAQFHLHFELCKKKKTEISLSRFWFIVIEMFQYDNRFDSGPNRYPSDCVDTGCWMPTHHLSALDLYRNAKDELIFSTRKLRLLCLDVNLPISKDGPLMLLLLLLSSYW